VLPLSQLVASYPPAHHVLRDLELAIDPTGEGSAVARIPLDERMVAHGEPVPGVLTTVVDALGGHLALSSVLPDWMATSELTTHRWGTPSGSIVCEGTVLRRGRTNLVVQVVAHDQVAAFARATLAFSVLPRRADTLEVDPATVPGGMALSPDGERLQGSLTQAIGYEIVADGAQVSLAEYVRNSFGALNGGVLAGLTETAAIGASGGTVRQLTVHYLRQATVGPVVARRRALGTAGGLTVHEVDALDLGADDRHVAVATAMVERHQSPS
jgi:acyl-coenzyme A thioesterase PaaI-like protein